MSRLRRQNRDSRLIPVAAEVLEVRSLLSASVHSAVAHAQHDLHAAATQQGPVVVFPTTYSARVDVQGTVQGQAFDIHGLNFAGTFQGASAPVQVGKKVKIGINQANINQGADGLTINSVKGTIGGKVLSFNDIGGGEHELEIVPSGHIAVTMTVAGHTIKATISANPQIHVILDVTGAGNSDFPYQLVNLFGSYQITKPKGATGSVSFFISPPPP